MLYKHFLHSKLFIGILNGLTQSVHYNIVCYSKYLNILCHTRTYL